MSASAIPLYCRNDDDEPRDGFEDFGLLRGVILAALISVPLWIALIILLLELVR